MDIRDRPVSLVMNKEMAVMSPDERLDLADDIMRLVHVRHVPVVEDGRLVGLLSSHDLLAASLAKVFDVEEPHRRTFLRAVDVGEVMSRPVCTASPDTTMAEAAELMVKRKISALPVVDRDDTLIGLVTLTDLVEVAYLGREVGESPKPEREVEAVKEKSRPLEKELDELRRTRDELKVQMHLAKAEAQDLYSALEHKLANAEAHAKRLSGEVAEPLEEVGVAAQLLVDEVREGYRRVKAALVGK